MSDKPTVRLEDTPVVADDGTVDMASLSKSGLDVEASTLEINADAVEADELFDAFIAGFMLSGEGHNAEYPYSFSEDDIRDDKHEDFVDWLEDYAPGVWL